LISDGFDDLVLQFVIVKQFPLKYVVNARDLWLEWCCAVIMLVVILLTFQCLLQ